MAITLLPDVEEIYSTFLRSRSEVTALVADRVYTILPKTPRYPLVLLEQIDDRPVMQRPLHLTRVSIQVSVLGWSSESPVTVTGMSSKKACRVIAETIRQVSTEMDQATHDGAVVASIESFSGRNLPDPTFSPARPRWLFTAALTVHPA